MTSINKKAFIEFMLESNVLRFGQFKTKSGRLSPYFVNTGNYCKGSQLSSLGNYYASLIKEKTDDNFDALFGPAYKGIPLVSAACDALYRNYSLDKHYFFNRKEQKDHGEGGVLVGYQPKEGDKIIIIEDVITAGTAVREIMPILKGFADVSVKDMFISVNRMEIGQNGRTASSEIFNEFGISLHSIIDANDIYNYLKEYCSDNLSDNGIPLYKEMEEYMSRYCILS